MSTVKDTLLELGEVVLQATSASVETMSRLFRTLIRNFTTSLPRPLIKPPLEVHSVDGKYATALYSAALKSNTLDVTHEELLKLDEAIKSETPLRELLNDPTVKQQLVIATFEELGTKLSLSPVTRNFLQLVAENGRTKQLTEIIAIFKLMMTATNKVVSIYVTVAKDLTSAQRDLLETTLKLFLKEDESLKVNVTINPAILGGMVVRVGDNYLDMSISTIVKKYHDLMLMDINE